MALRYRARDIEGRSMANGNPFSPRFGAVPPVLAGRREILREMSLVADGDFNSPSCASLLLGTRGMGKTTLLQVVEDDFAGRGWLALSISGRGANDMLDNLAARATALWQRLQYGERPRDTAQISSVTAAGFGVSTERVPAEERSPDLRETLAMLGHHAQSNETGLLVTIDELHDARLDDVREFGAIFQHESSRHRLPLVFVGAGLLEMKNTLLSDRMSTFLHRCEQFEIDLLSREESWRALAEPITANGGTIAPADLDRMLDAAAGHPYMLQTVGYDVWKVAADPSAGITSSEVEAGLEESRQDMGPRIFRPIWEGLSQIDKRLLVCMLHDPEVSSVSDLAPRWGKDPGHVASYRQRLIAKGFIRSSGWGKIEFAHPEARRYTRLQSQEEGWILTEDGTPVDPTDSGPSLT